MGCRRSSWNTATQACEDPKLCIGFYALDGRASWQDAPQMEKKQGLKGNARRHTHTPPTALQPILPIPQSAIRALGWRCAQVVRTCVDSKNLLLMLHQSAELGGNAQGISNGIHLQYMSAESLLTTWQSLTCTHCAGRVHAMPVRCSEPSTVGTNL